MNKSRTGELSSTQLSELRLGELSIRSRRFFEIKLSNYIRARSAHNVIPILWIKSEYDLILPSHPHPYVTFSILLIFCFVFIFGVVLQKLKIGSKEYGSLFHIDWKYCCFSYARTWELVDLFVGTKNFS